VDKDKRLEMLKRESDGVSSMLDSDRPNIMLHGALKAIGAMEEGGDKSLSLKFHKKITVLVARLSFWTPDDIEAALEEGRKMERTTSELANK